MNAPLSLSFYRNSGLATIKKKASLNNLLSAEFEQRWKVVPEGTPSTNCTGVWRNTIHTSIQAIVVRNLSVSALHAFFGVSEADEALELSFGSKHTNLHVTILSPSASLLCPWAVAVRVECMGLKSFRGLVFRVTLGFRV